jgi:methionyl-tRNA formyltransferase
MVSAGTAPLRIVYFGTPGFAVPALRALHDSRHTVVGVVTQPDKPQGRGQRLTPGAVKQMAMSVGLRILQPVRLRDEAFLAELRSLEADLGVVAAYGRILTDAILTIPRLGMLNVHASLLPKYRGAAPVHRAVMAGEAQTGVTIMRVVQALDAGPILSAIARPIAPDETSEDVELALADLGASALIDALSALGAGRATEVAQDDALATYARKIETADGIVDWSRPASAIHNQIRGLHPWPHAFSSLEGERTILLRSSLGGSDASAGEPGTIVEAGGDVLTVQTGRGLLRLVTLQREGRRPVSAREFIAGRRLKAGVKFSTAGTRS